MRVFDTGATRDDDSTKIDYDGFLSPLVLEAYGNYLHKHRIQSDGQLRDSDNWKKGIPIKQYIKSKWRHFMRTWGLTYLKWTEEEMVDSLCAELFNTMGMLHEVLKGKRE